MQGLRGGREKGRGEVVAVQLLRQLGDYVLPGLLGLSSLGGDGGAGGGRGNRNFGEPWHGGGGGVLIDFLPQSFDH